MANICIISTVHPTFDTRIFEKQAKSLVEAGHSVDYFTPHETTETVDGVNIIPMTKPRNRIHRFLLPFVIPFQLKKSKYDVYHVHDPELIVSGLILEYISKASVIADIHEDYRLTLKDRPWIWSPLRPIVYKLFDKSEPFLLKRLTGVILASDDFLGHYDHHPQVKIIKNYPRLKWISDASTSVEYDLHLVFVGEITKHKSVIPVIKALENIPEDISIKFDICGRASNQDIDEKIQKYSDINQNIAYHGWIPHHKVMDICASTDFGIVPLSDKYSNGYFAAYRSRKVFEYLASNNGILVPNFGNWPELVENYNIGISLDVNDQEAIKEVLIELAKSRNSINQYKQNGREVVIEEFNWESQQSTLVSFYDNVLS